MTTRFLGKAVGLSAISVCTALAVAPVAAADEGKPGKKLSFYDDDDEVTKPTPANETAVVIERPNNSVIPYTNTQIEHGVKVRTSAFLEKHIALVRKWVSEKAVSAKKSVDSNMSEYLKTEHEITSTVASLKSSDEDVLPGAIYVLVAGLSGSILARNRSFPLRFATPIALGWATFAFTLPKTYNNTRALVWKYEQRAPAVADAHAKTEQQLVQISKDVEDGLSKVDDALVDTVHSSRVWLADQFGLKGVGSKK